MAYVEISAILNKRMVEFKNNWKKVPEKLRQAIVLLIGLSLVILAGALGPLPGPGGIPLFLLGIAILGSEFHWAKRFGDWMLRLVDDFASHLKAHPQQARLFWLVVALWLILIVVWFIWWV